MDIHFEPPKSVSETQRATADAARRNEELGVELSNEKQHRAMSSAATLRKEIFKSNNAAEKQLRRCHELELYNEGLRKKIQNVRKRQIDQSRMRGGETTTRENARLLKRQTEILEDKLSMAFKKFNTTLDKNSKLRQEIDRLTNERHIFDKVYTRIEEEVVLYEEETLQVETETADREKQCKEVRESIKEMIAKDREEAEKFEVLIAESQSKIKHTAQKNEVGIGVIPLPSSAKSARPASEQEATGAEAAAVAAVAKLKEDPLVAMAAATMDEALNEKTKAGTMTKEEEARLLARGARYRWEAVQNKAIIQKSAKKIAEIRNLMESLQEVSGVKDVDELAEVFRHNEDRMFELAGKINEDSKQVEVLQKEIDALSTDLDRDDGAKERRTKAKKQMQQIRETRHKSKRFVEMKQEADNEIVALNEALEDICRSMQGSRYRFELRSRYSSVGSPTTDELADDDSAIDGGDMGSTHSSTREKSSPPTNASVATELTDALSDDGTGTSHVMRNLGTLEHIYRVLARATNSNKFEVKRPEKFMERSVAVATKFVCHIFSPKGVLSLSCVASETGQI
eukprot:INCI3281.1.p1 GENE.INCI3281.1~~INCI3281.1.p1  ORF type:complete len:571 (-),score=148.25 INCI3281.1:657-2369(-)